MLLLMCVSFPCCNTCVVVLFPFCVCSDGRAGEVRVVLAGGARLDARGRLVAELPLAATVVGNVALPLVVLLALLAMHGS